MAAAAAAASSAAILSATAANKPKRKPHTAAAAAAAANITSTSYPFSSAPLHHLNRTRWLTSARASLTLPPVTPNPQDLITSIFDKVLQTDRGVLLKKNDHLNVAKAAQQLQQFCVPRPVKCPLIFGEWDVVYCSNPTSPGGGYRSAFGRLIFKTKEMIQVIEAPDIVKNKVAFSALGCLDGAVSLKGKLEALDEKWIKVVFEAPEFKLGFLEFTYGGESEVKLEITYVDDEIRLGKGSRGSLFVFQRRKL